MNNTIFTRKLGLGILIALVFAFGVHGVADAVLTARKVSRDHQDKLFNQDFTFSFSISGVPGSRTGTDTARDSITITVAGTGVALSEVRSDRTYPTTATTFTLTERRDTETAGDGRLRNGTISVKCKLSEAGSFTVTIADAASPAGFTSLVFTAYGIQRPEDIDAQVFSASTGTTNPKSGIGFDSPQNEYSADSDVVVTLAGTGSAWVYVDFSVDGPGRLYRDLDDNMRPDATPRSTLRSFTFGDSEASVKLQMNGGTNKVTASIKDATNKTHVITYFYQSIQLNRVSGNGQVGLPGSQLAEPLVVEVTDTRGTGISGQEVEFSLASGTTGTLVRIPSYTRVGTSGHKILTDSNGQAKINYVLPDTHDTDATITAGFDSNNDGDTEDDEDHSVSFTVTANDNAVVTPRTPIRQPPPSDDDDASLTVTAPRSGNAGQTITVTAATSNNRASQLVAFTSNRGGTFRPVNGPTDSNGDLTTQFTLPSTAGEVIITANANGYTAGTATVNVVGSALTVTPNPILGATAGQRYSIVVGAGRQDVLVTLSGNGFTSAQGTTLPNGSVTIFITLPSTTGTYQLYASAPGYERKLIPVTVTRGGTPSTGTSVELRIPSGQTQSVAIGTNAPLRVRVTRTGTTTGQSGVTVTFRNASGTTIHTTTPTGTNGDATYNFPVTRLGLQTVSATLLPANNANFDLSGVTPVTFTITGTRQQPTQSTRLRIFQPVDSLNQPITTGAPGAPYTLTILLYDANNNPVPYQVGTLTVTDSTGVTVGTSVQFTVYNGRSNTQDTFNLPQNPGQYTITARTGTTTTGIETATITVTVFAIRILKDNSDSVSGDNQEGNRGEVLDDPFLLKVVRDVANVETPVQGVPVTFTIVDGDGELSTSSSASSGSSSLTVRSEANGELRAYLVLGEDDEDNRVRASVGITTVSDVFFDATGALVPYDLEIVSGNNQRGTPNRYLTNALVVRVTDEDGYELQGVTVTFSLRGSGTLTRSDTTDRNGEAFARFLPRTAGTHYIEARVTGIPSVRFTITAGDLADSIEIVSGNNQSGEPGTELEDPLVVEVLDEDDDVVSGVTVTFSVTAGGGSLSETSVTTNSRGRAETDLTLGDDPGRNTVRASVSGVSDRVTFTATAEDPAPPEPDIRLPVAQRADTYWINRDTGTIHRLVGNSVEDIAHNVQDVVSLVATKNRLFWVEKTSNSSGRIRSANLNGSNVQLIRNLSTAPAGITVDTVNSKLYVTTERGKIQAINVDGSDYEPNLLVGLDTPTDIAVDPESGKLFWISESGTVHYANVDGSDETEFANGYDTLGSIAVGAGKVFWTEETSGSAGKIHSANLDGSNVQELISLSAAPYGISVDVAGKKLYWTNIRGKIMQSNINGKSAKAVVADLVSLGDISVPAGTTAIRPPGTFSKYDVNKDGVVDNTDAALVADALGETNPDNPRLDVNGDGRVNFLDLLLVFDNRDETNAAPIAVADAKLPKVSREEVQRQIDLLIASNNDSLTAQQTLAYLQSLLEVVSPERTRLLANYPNPFNPETWIPYQLATDSNVQITIFNTTGNVVRTLKLGHQSEGYYTDRSRAAYWDGRNAIGEQVASGVYFYVFTANEFSATRKMLILK